MHSRLEIIMPPTDDIESQVEQILKQFSEDFDPDEGYGKYSFFDWYVIGGRFSGSKTLDIIGRDKILEFKKRLESEEIMVHGVRFGKPEIATKEQEEYVDSLWASTFPEYKGKCILFKHSNDQYSDSASYPDVMTLGETPLSSIKVPRAIIASAGFDGTVEAQFMYSDGIYNGVNYQDTEWDGLLSTFLDDYLKKIEDFQGEYRERITPRHDWLVVTVDYHD